MQQVILRRTAHGNQGTQGELIVGGAPFCRTLELPWRDNARQISCIPCGTYDVRLRQSPRFGRVYEVQDVPGRDYILLHSGNLAGDVAQGFKTHVLGCILLGRYFGRLQGQLAVLASRPAVRDFVEAMDGQPFRLVVEDLCGN